jgi:hypothetical protein
MSYFKITPHPILVEAEDAETAALKARQLILHARVHRYEVVGPDGAAIWVELSAEDVDVASLSDRAADLLSLPKETVLEEPQVVVKRSLFRRLFNRFS